MNPFNFPIEKLDKLDDLQPIIKGSTFSLLQQAGRLTQQAQTQALEMLRQADLEATEMQEKAAQLGHFQQSLLALKIREETQQATVAQALQWLVDERHMESVIIHKLETRVREIMANVLEEWLTEQDQVSQLASRLARLVRDRAQQRPCKLRLHPDTCDTLEAQLSELIDLSEIDCVADATLNPEQAVIETEFLRIEFDLAQHRNAVLEALRNMQPEQEVEHV